MASSSSSTARRYGRPPTHQLFTQSSAAPIQHVDIGIYLSTDGRRLAQDAPSPPRKKRRVEPSDLDDNFANWDPGNGEDEGEDFDEGDVDGQDGPSNVVSNLDLLAARHRYISSDHPMLIWRQGHIQEFLQEMLRHEGLGEHRRGAVCATCNEQVLVPLPATSSEPHFDALLRCQDCHGDCVECLPCCLKQHERLPLHRTQRWTGQYWEKRTLKDLGLVVQLGHPGTVCHNPDNVFKLTVLDSHGIHEIAARYCQCELALQASKRAQLLRLRWYPATVTDPTTCATFRVLEEFHLQHLKGALNVHNWIGALAMRTDGTKVSLTPDREKTMSRVFRQWAFLKRLKRSGRGHDPAGVHATKPGETAVLCWACPQEGKNLPSNWQDVDEKFKFLYVLILAMDANFRLTNRMRANEHDDAELGPGWGCMVDSAPYKEHLKNYVSEADITTCIAFMALLQKDSKMTTGLRTSGVGACMCARHEVVRPCGVGDLQKGERYSNMDYIFFSSIMAVILLHFAISYDIVCQWKINIAARHPKLPPHIQQSESDQASLRERLAFGLPVWHAAAHEDKCQVTNSLRYQPGMGHTDREGIERGWSRINPHASSTKEMGQGARHDTLDDIFNHHNWERNIALGDMLSRRLIIAKEERDVQVRAFSEVRDTIPLDAAVQWVAEVTAWEKERKLPVKDQKAPNPYEMLKNGGVTEAQVRLKLRQEETAEVHEGRAALHETSATGFLAMGLHIEKSQIQIGVDTANFAQLTANQASLLEERRLQVWRKLRVFRDMQRVYVPHAAAFVLAEDEQRRREDLPQPLAENVRLFMPSDLPVDVRQAGCVTNLPAMELQLRVAQCDEALDAIRGHLHAKKHLINRRNKNVTGQKKSTCSRTVIGLVGDRVAIQFKKYTQAREALFKLGGVEEFGARFKVLLHEHLVLDSDEQQDDHEASRRMNRAGGGGPRSSKKKPAFTPGDSTRVMSWIWFAGTFLKTVITAVCMHREYLKARARKHRWVEEVSLLTEEMRRVLRFLTWHADWWMDRDTDWDGVHPDVADGLRAYALRQAASCRSIAEHFSHKWGQKDVMAARDAAAATSALLGLEDTIMM